MVLPKVSALIQRRGLFGFSKIKQPLPEIDFKLDQLSKNAWSIDLPISAPNDIPGHYLFLYTCGVCGAADQKSCTKNSYHNGVVLIRCDTCRSIHLIADNLGWFSDEKVNVESILAAKGISIRKTKFRAGVGGVGGVKGEEQQR